jgi:putative Mg2+ transporter-C (MgtC) family protein
MNLIDFNQLEMIAMVVLAMLLGAVIGLDREWAHKPAGLRTHMLVAGASALLVGLTSVVIKDVQLELDDTLLRADPIRIIEAVITGVSFLGAGTIITRGQKGEVEGLTTAASILMAAAVGISVGLWQLILAGGVTLIAVIALRGVPLLETWLKKYL